jgi:pimeloyl-ACP methyl ester carboxylesterase
MSIWAGDVSFVLDQLDTMNRANDRGLFNNQLDLERVGILGHSTGGGNTVQVCWREPRCKVGFVMDAWLMPVSEEVFDEVLLQPFMFMWSEDWGSDENKERFKDLYAKLGEDSYSLKIAGTSHFDFSDVPLLSPLSPWFGIKGPIDGRRVLKIINDYAVAYFDEYLKGKESSLLEGPSSEYSEVAFEKKGP